MEADNAAPETNVPVKVPEPAEHAPPTLAEPASGPVAEMSGALAAQTSDTTAAAAPKVANGEITASSDVSTSVAEPTEQPSTAPDSVPSTTDAAISQETEIKPPTEVVVEPEVEDAGVEANGSAAEKKAPNGKKKSSAQVPEHKNKKLNKKKSVTKITHLDAQPGDLFFARLKSYPPWPSIICDEEILPTTLLNTRPVTTRKADGTYNEPYADGGKKVSERTFPVMFLYTNEFAWIPNTDLTELNPEDCKDVAEKGKSKSLIAAYRVASEGHDLQYFKTMLLEHAKAVEEDEALRAEKAAEKAEKAERTAAKKKRKSETKVDEDVEMQDVDDVVEVKKSTKKRKKANESDDEEPEKPAKTPKTTKLKLTTTKTPTTTEKKSKEKQTKPKGEKRKSKAAVDDEETADDPEPEPEPVLDPEEARKAREREVLFLRHKLQKGFLTRDQAPREDDMPQMSNFIKKLENYEELEVSIIRATKINKVLKAIVKLNTIPKDEDFNFRSRSMELLGKWNKILGAEPQEADSGDKDSKGTPATNGVHDDDKGETVDEKPVEEANPVSLNLKSSATGNSPAASAPAVEEPQKQTIGVDKAPEASAGAAEATEVVKAAE